MKSSMIQRYFKVELSRKTGEGKVLQNKQRLSFSRNLPQTDWVSDRILTSKNHIENYPFFSQKHAGIKKEERIVIINLAPDVSLSIIIGRFQNPTKHKSTFPSSGVPLCLLNCLDAILLSGKFLIFSRTNTEKASDRKIKSSFSKQPTDSLTPGMNHMVHALGYQTDGKAKKGGDTRWQ